MQEFLKNEQEKYLYYYNDNELERFYFYQQMPENDDLSLNNKQEFFKIIFREWKIKQINFLLQNIYQDIETYFPEKNKVLLNSLNEIEIFKTFLIYQNNNSHTNEKTNLPETNLSNNPNLVLYNNINNYTLIQGNHSVEINENKFENKNFTYNNSNFTKNSNNEEAIPSKRDFLNSVSINDCIQNNSNDLIKNSDYNSKNHNDLINSNGDVDLSFFSNRQNTEFLISYLMKYLQGMEKQMLIFIQEELEKNIYLKNESISFLINSYKSLINYGTRQGLQGKFKLF